MNPSLISLTLSRGQVLASIAPASMDLGNNKVTAIYRSLYDTEPRTVVLYDNTLNREAQDQLYNELSKPENQLVSGEIEMYIIETTTLENASSLIFNTIYENTAVATYELLAVLEGNPAYKAYISEPAINTSYTEPTTEIYPVIVGATEPTLKGLEFPNFNTQPETLTPTEANIID